MRLLLACFFMLFCSVVTAEEPAGQVLKILKKRCVACHGSVLAHPKGKFGHITDLPRLVTEPQFLVPGKPLESEMFLLMSEAEMPPRKSSSAPMPKAEIKVIEDWIIAGTPIPEDWLAGAGGGGGARTSSWRVVLAGWMGKLHPFVIHFPIGLIVVVALVQGFCHKERTSGMIRYGLRFGAAGAVGAAMTGWCWALSVDASETLTRHRWIGVATAILCVGLVILEKYRQQHPRWFGVLLWVTTILVLIVGHLGGELVHGPFFG